jgi:GntR family transcriptional regulator, transcriptional repressor for pyruvate dehydrogenase complex
MYQRVKRQDKLSQQVADQIEVLYREGKITAGQRLPAERELCDQFGVSRTVIREAINILVAKGLLISQSGSGTYVQEIGQDNIRDALSLFFQIQNDEEMINYAFELRSTLEVQIARIAAQRRTDKNLEELEVITERMGAKTGNPKEFSSLDIQFHLALTKATQNPFFEMFLDPYFHNIEKLIDKSNLVPGRAAKTTDSHRLILDAVRAGNGDSAAHAMQDHLNSFRDISLLSFGRGTQKTE